MIKRDADSDGGDGEDGEDGAAHAESVGGPVSEASDAAENADDADDADDAEDAGEIIFPTVEQVKALHAQVILRFSPGESLRVRDEGLLESAVAAPQASWGGVFLHRTLGAMAAALMYSLGQNHAFDQGNKRIAFAAADFFLRLNGYYLSLSHDAAVELTLNMVNGRWDQERCAHTIERAMEEL